MDSDSSAWRNFRVERPIMLAMKNRLGRLLYPGRMTRSAWAMGLIAISAGCTQKNPVLVCKNGTCSDPQYPFCDIDGAVRGEPNTCIAVSCTPAAFAACDGDNAITCDQNGTNYGTQHCSNGCSADAMGCNACAPNASSCGADGNLHVCDAQGHDSPVPCAAGCLDSPQPHCAYLQPHYLADICDAPAQGALNIASMQTIDTSIDNTCTGGIVAQSGGPDICVARYSTMSISSGATLQIVASTTGNNAKNRPIAFVVDGDLLVDGLLDGAARGARSMSGSNGPGGGYLFAGGNDISMGGAGGAGFATRGGNGGGFQMDGGAQDAGPQLPNPLDSVFIGGPSNDGPGGGAVMLISCRGTVKVSGVISLGGGGAHSGFLGPFCWPGTGGGAGGNLLVEGMNVEITGSLYANGGGGGAGCAMNTQMASDEDGEDAQLSDTAAAAGGSPPAGAGAGGVGGIATSLPGDGRRDTVSTANPGGGGGSVGWLQAGTPAAITPKLTPAHTSPPLQPKVTVDLR